MNIIFMGTPDFAASVLKKITESRHRVSLVVTQPDKPKGRSRELQPSDVKKLALEEGLPVFQPEKVRTKETYEELKKYDADVFVVAAYGRIIPKDILELPKYGCINVHASLLPKYRGAAPIQWAVIDGEEKSGVCIMQMDEGLDTGDIIAEAEIPLDKKETSDSLFGKLSVLGADTLVETLDRIEKGDIHPVPQPKESTTAYARMITKADGRIDWNEPAEKIERIIRGMNSWPGAYSDMNGHMVKIWDADVINENDASKPGTVVKADKNGLIIQTGEGQLSINELQLQGKKRMRFDEFLRGSRWEAGMCFGD